MPLSKLDLKDIQKSLILEDINKLGDISWLLNSYEKQEDFWNNILEIRDYLLNGKSKTIPYKYYNFYDDILIKIQQSNANILEYYDEFGEYNSISYSKAKLLTDIVAKELEDSGVSAGDKLAIIYPFGISFLVFLLAGLKIGATLCPVINKRLVKETLELINPDFIVSDINYRATLAKWKEDIIDIDIVNLKQVKPPETFHSYSYRSGELVFLIPNKAINSLIKISADEAYLYPLRDAIIIYALAPLDKLASIGFEPPKSLILLVSSMLVGASYLFITREALTNCTSNIFNDLQLKALGMSESTIDILLDISPELPKRCDILFRDPSESVSFDRFQKVIDKLGLKNALVTNVRLEPKIFGSSFSSIRFKGKAHQYVFPSPGLNWNLVSLLDSKCKSVLEYGCITIPMFGDDEEEKDLEDIISKFNQTLWLYVSSYVPIPKRVKKEFPVSFFTDVIERFRDESSNKKFEYSLLFIPSTEKVKVVLLIFVGDFSHFSEEKWKEVFIETFSKELGREFLPDKIEFFNLYPRYKPDGTIDNKWCYDQYISGMLYKKNNIEVYRILSSLRKLTLNK